MGDTEGQFKLSWIFEVVLKSETGEWIVRISQLLWAGFWQGVGVELSFFALFLLWSVFYRKHGYKFDAEHLVHAIHDYFTI